MLTAGMFCKKIKLNAALLGALTLVGCGGGGGSSNTVAVSAGVPTPSLLRAPASLSITYQNAKQEILQDAALYRKYDESYTAPNEPSYGLSSYLGLIYYVDDADNKRYTNMGLDGVVYLDKGQFTYLDGKTLKTKAIGSPIAATKPGTFCGFWESVLKQDSNHTQYFVYSVADSCVDTAQETNFYLASTSNTATTPSRKIDRPIAALNDGWLVAKTPNLNTVDIYRCNVDCSQQTYIGRVNGNKLRPFAHEATLSIKNENKLFSVDGSSVYVFNTATNALTSLVSNINLPSDTSIVAEDEQYFYIPHSETIGASELIVIAKHDFSQKTTINLKSIGLTPFELPSIGWSYSFKDVAMTKDYFYLKMSYKTSEYVAAIQKSTLAASIIFSSDSSNYKTIEFANSEWVNNKVYVNLLNEANGLYRTGYFSNIQFSGELNPVNEHLFLATVGETTDVNYIPQVNTIHLNFENNPLQLASTSINLGQIKLSGNNWLYQPMLTFGNIGGGFILDGSANKYYIYDINKSNSVECLYGC
ncbi:MAG: hypothetical protein V4525_08740 [Pseudomonadota bacterium]